MCIIDDFRNSLVWMIRSRIGLLVAAKHEFSIWILSSESFDIGGRNGSSVGRAFTEKELQDGEGVSVS